MSTILSESLRAIAADSNRAYIADITRGIEKESLRIAADGQLATTEHPKVLGSALTHPQITTDYSEALLEFITAPNRDSHATIEQLNQLHAYTYQKIASDKESLWVNSMPCALREDNDIPIAQYGSSNSGTMKSVYRLGLGHRYGRAMQTIAGIHYNFSVSDDFWQHLMQQENSALSLQDFKTQGYFRLIRNFRRYFWLLLYLYGASPAICRSFIGNRPHQLTPIDNDSHSLHAPYGTSLRMGDLGYQSNAQKSLVITYNCLNTYTNTLCDAITQTHDDYARIGIKNSNEKLFAGYQQLSSSLLQIENEFYSVIRPKRTSKSGETALSALTNRGVEYIEVRCLDLNPYDPVGLNEQQTQFLDTFLVFCLLQESPASSETEHLQLQENQKRMVYSGRDPSLELYDKGQQRKAREWGKEIMSELSRVALLMDDAKGGSAYQQSIALERNKLDDAELTPSAKILSDIKEQGITFHRWAMNQSLAHQKHFMQYALSDQQKADYAALAKASLQQQATIEASDHISFEKYLANYYDQYQCAKKQANLPQHDKSANAE